MARAAPMRAGQDVAGAVDANQNDIAAASPPPPRSAIGATSGCFAGSDTVHIGAAAAAVVMPAT